MASRSQRMQEKLKEVKDMAGKRIDSAKEVVINNARKRRDNFRRAVTGNEGTRVRDHFRVKRDKLLLELRRPIATKAKDKASFTLGVGVLILSEFVLLKYPGFFPIMFTALIVPLVAVRYVIYHKQKYHYFMIDFCYYNLCLGLAHVWVWPNSAFLARILFVFSNGPLIWAVAAWRNSLVFHSLDKTTSLYIHVMPCLLTYCTRWESVDGISSGCDPKDPACDVDWASTYWSALGFYAAWQLAYVLKTDVADSEKLKRDTDIQTSVRWFTRSKSGILYHGTLRLMKRMKIMKPDEGFDGDTWKTKVVFMAVQLVYTMVTALPTMWFFHSFTAHVTFLVGMLGLSIWNGAVYYIEVFSRVYMKRLEALVAERQARSESGDSLDGFIAMDSDYPPKADSRDHSPVAEVASAPSSPPKDKDE